MMTEENLSLREPKLSVLSVLRSQAQQKSRIAFIIREDGTPTLLREIGSSNHKFTLAALMEREALLLKQEAFTECGLAAYSAA